MKRLAVEGNIGSGKSSALRAIGELCAALGVAPVRCTQEPVAVWRSLPAAAADHNGVGGGGPTVNVLDAFYADTRRRAFAMQTLADTSTADALWYDVADETLPALWAQERTLAAREHTFTRVAEANGFLDPVETAVLAHQARFYRNKACPHLYKYDAIVYLRCPPATCMERVRLRDRLEERAGSTAAAAGSSDGGGGSYGGVSLRYLEQLHDAYERWCGRRFEHLRVDNVLVLDADRQLSDVAADLRSVLVDTLRLAPP